MKLQKIIQGYLGMQPKDKNCINWSELQEKMEREILELYAEELDLYSHMHLIESAVNYYWNDTNQNLERKDLGDIERQIYLKQKEKSLKVLNILI